MKKEDFAKLGADDALAAKMAEASADELRGFIPKSRFDEVNTELKQSRESVAERDAQLETLKKATGDSDALQKQITDLQLANKMLAEAHAAEINQFKLDTAVNSALTAAKARNPETVKPLLRAFLEKAELDGDAVKGLDDEIKKLAAKEETKFLFDAAPAGGKPAFRGVKPGEGTDGGIDAESQAQFEARLAAARKSGGNAEAISIKREAAELGIILT
jgi:hypothetical protein